MGAKNSKNVGVASRSRLTNFKLVVETHNISIQSATKSLSISVETQQKTTKKAGAERSRSKLKGYAETTKSLYEKGM